MRRGFLNLSGGQPSGKPAADTSGSSQPTRSGDLPFDNLLAACECLPEYGEFVAEAAKIQRRMAKSAGDARRMRQKLQKQMSRALSQSLADAELLEDLEPLTSVDHSTSGSSGLLATDSMDVLPPMLPPEQLDEQQPLQSLPIADSLVDPPPPSQPPLFALPSPEASTLAPPLVVPPPPPPSEPADDFPSMHWPRALMDAAVVDPDFWTRSKREAFGVIYHDGILFRAAPPPSASTIENTPAGWDSASYPLHERYLVPGETVTLINFTDERHKHLNGRRAMLLGPDWEPSAAGPPSSYHVMLDHKRITVPLSNVVSVRIPAIEDKATEYTRGVCEDCGDIDTGCSSADVQWFQGRVYCTTCQGQRRVQFRPRPKSWLVRACHHRPGAAHLR